VMKVYLFMFLLWEMTSKVDDAQTASDFTREH
jgi:hypothetical protein